MHNPITCPYFGLTLDQIYAVGEQAGEGASCQMVRDLHTEGEASHVEGNWSACAVTERTAMQLCRVQRYSLTLLIFRNDGAIDMKIVYKR